MTYRPHPPARGDDQPPRPLWRPDEAYPKRHTVGDHHPGQRRRRKARERRRRDRKHPPDEAP